jgi:diamine N-acetyltransferase
MNFRKAIHRDIPYIRDLEQNPEFRNLVGSWSKDEHLKTLNDPDAAYWIMEDESEKIVAFVLLRGLRSEHFSLELKRIVVGLPNQGFGKRLLDAVLAKAFDEYGAHRIWLDVFETNARARHVYRTLGFQEDGILREAVYRSGKYYSLVLMSLLDREYRHRRESHPETNAAT